jgi:hypothetical protein
LAAQALQLDLAPASVMETTALALAMGTMVLALLA